MELRHLRTIVAVAHHRALTKAGEQLFLSQSAVSQQIRRLEEELGVEVFRRTSRSVALTPEGQVILGYAKRVLAEVDGMQSELDAIGPEPLTWPIALVWRVARRQTPAGKAFIAVALDHAKRTERPGLRAA